MMIPRRRGGGATPVFGRRGGALFRTRTSNAVRAARTVYAAAKKLAPLARAAGAQSTLVRKIRAGSGQPNLRVKRIRQGSNQARPALQALPAMSGNEYAAKMARRYRPSNKSGAYTGEVKLKTIKPKASIYDYKGVKHENETAGTSTMLYCNYVGYQSVRPYEIGRLIGMALMRHVMSTYYMVDFNSPTETIWPNADLASVGGKPASFQFWWEQSLGATTSRGSVTYTLTGTETLASFGTWFTDNVFVNPGSTFGGAGGSSTRIWKDLWVNEPVLTGAGSATYTTVTTKRLRIDKMIISAYSIANFTIQNATASDGQNSLIDVVDANPLRGKLYVMNTMAPMLANLTQYAGTTATQTYDELCVANSNGLIMPSVDPPLPYRAPPSPQQLERVKGYQHLNFEPGESKSFTLKFRFTGNINYLMQNLNQAGNSSSYTNTYGSRYGKCLGQCMLFALEKRIKGGPASETAPIILNYHCDHYAGAVIKYFQRTRMDKEIIQQERDNDPV